MPFDPHAEWLGNVQPTGILVAGPALERHGIVPTADGRALLSLQERLSAWAAANATPSLFQDVFGWQAADLLSGDDVPGELGLLLPETSHVLRPDHAVPDPGPAPGGPAWQMLVRDLPAGTDFDAATPQGSWFASPGVRHRTGRIARFVARTVNTPRISWWLMRHGSV